MLGITRKEIKEKNRQHCYDARDNMLSLWTFCAVLVISEGLIHLTEDQLKRSAIERLKTAWEALRNDETNGREDEKVFLKNMVSRHAGMGWWLDKITFLSCLFQPEWFYESLDIIEWLVIIWHPIQLEVASRKLKKNTTVQACTPCRTPTLWDVQRAWIHPWAAALDELKTGYWELNTGMAP